MKGVPIRLEIGPRDVKNKQVVLVRRDNGEKIIAEDGNIESTIRLLLKDIQENMFETAKNFMLENTHEVDNFDEFKEIIDRGKGFIKAHWCGSSECENQIKEETGATLRCIPFEEPEEGKCIVCNNRSKQKVYFAKSY